MAQHLLDRHRLLGSDIIRGDHGKRCGHLLLRCFDPGCRHYHGRQGLFLLRLRSQRSIGEENEKQDEKEKIHKISFSRERGVLGQNGQVSWLRLYQPAEKGPSASLRLPRSLQRTAKVRLRSRRFARLASGTFLIRPEERVATPCLNLLAAPSHPSTSLRQAQGGEQSRTKLR